MKYVRLLPLIALLLAAASCAKPPQAEIDAARAALTDASRADDVVTYAPDALRAAQERMAELDAEMAAQSKKSALSRSYETAGALAAEIAELARAAVIQAGEAKQQVAAEAAVLAEEVTAAIPTFESKVWAARRVARIKLDLILPLQQVPAQARAIVEDARKDISSGAFAEAKAKLMAVKDRLSTGTQTITEQTRIARSTRR